ncbi:von Willebrand factor type D domain-containing protein [Roseovarius marisflavi]|uniref:von Willebrand factor type D domain-containing protein n=1 Tax=Roseovarius marisflavi TaxID=1054996 RepID=A0A1M7D428_9RHOB|nr:VWD domain-containing protein [Roseovarius marisflavi]SHL74147.1 von Willebrand factor type D domain-containing protein [Roseovarius marisflavi]
MPTFTLSGFQVNRNSADTVTGVFAVDLNIVVPDGQETFTYNVIQTFPDDIPEVEINASEISATASGAGVPVPGGTASLPDNSYTYLGFIESSEGIHTVLIIEIQEDDGSLIELIYQIGGAPLTIPTTLAEFAALEASVDSIANFGPASGAFAEGATIDFNLLDNTVKDTNPTITGTAGDDALNGTEADDYIATGNATPAGDMVTGSTGNDTIDMWGNDGVNGSVQLDYSGMAGPLTVNIDGGANTGSVVKGADGTDTLLGVVQPLEAGWVNGGLGIVGTAAGDTFNLTPEGDQWMSVRGGHGADSYNINGTGLVRLDFRDAIQGIDVNLATGAIADDGFGNAETIGGTAPLWEVFGSSGNDIFTGSTGGDSYRYLGGSNTLDGGLGFDRLRYDTATVASVNIDATAGTATGTLTGGGTFTDTISGFERLRGSNGADQITGEAGMDNRFEGRGGADTFVHVGGNDTISDFDPNSETLIVRVAGLDQAGFDFALNNSVSDTPNGVFVDFGGGSTVLFAGRTLAEMGGANVQFLPSGGGNLVAGTNGNDNLDGTAEDDLILTGDNLIGDNVNGSAGNDTIDFTGITADPGGFVTVEYSGIGTTINVLIDGGANTGSVIKTGLGVDTFINVELPLFAGWTSGGLSIGGTSGADTFDVSIAGEQWMSIRPGDGVDTILIGGDPSLVRLDMRDGFGIDVDLANGTINDDGFGNAETIGGTAPLWEVFGSFGADIFAGSTGGDSYRYLGGSNTLDGGLGFDRLRYDTTTVASVNIDASAGTTGTVMGTLTGGGTFTDTISGFERFRGSQGNDSFIGSSESERFEAGPGNDTISAGGGNDTLEGGEGDATLNGGTGSDIFFVGNGRTVIEDFNDAEDSLDFSVSGLGVIASNTALANAFDNAGETTVDLGNGNALVFSNLTVAEAAALADPNVAAPPPPPPTPIAWTVGDPHLLTLDGVGYDFHAVGEFVLLRGVAGSTFDGFEVQSRMGPILDNLGDPVPNVSANIAIATRLGNGAEVMIDAADASPLSIGGVATVMADGEAINVGNDLIVRDGSMYTVVFAGADGTVGAGDARINVIVRDGFVDLSVQISTDMAGAVEGLLGDGNGNPDDDIARADGTVLERPLAFDDLYGGFRDDWRVTTDVQSLFTYDAGETLEGFYDPGAPGGVLGVDDFDTAAVAAARTLVENAGLTPGTLAYENALIDVLLTQDETFIESSSSPTASAPENTGSAGTLDVGETRITFGVSLVDEAGGGIGGAVVNFSAGGAPILGQAAGTPGAYNLRLGSSTGEGVVDAVRDYDAGTDPNINVSDALDALRLAVGLEPSFGPANAMDFIAADIDQSGTVNVTDALDILRFAVGLETGNTPKWVFLDDAQDLSGTDRTNVQYETGANSGVISDGGGLQLTGILLGNLGAEV